LKKISLDTTACLLSFGKLILLNDEALYKQYDPHNSMFYIIIFGWFELKRKDGESDEIKTASFGPGTFLGTNWKYNKHLMLR
jgi:CRP-like cAMP-binding protein